MITKLTTKQGNKLNMGCGDDILPDYVNADYSDYGGADTIVDFNTFPYPFKDNQFIYIKAQAILSHLNPNITIKIFEELHRISKHNAIISIRVPYMSRTWNALDHKREWNFFSFINLCNPFHEMKYFTKCKFEINRMYGIVGRYSLGRFIPNFKVCTWQEWRFGFRDVISMIISLVYQNIYVELKVKKNERFIYKSLLPIRK